MKEIKKIKKVNDYYTGEFSCFNVTFSNDEISSVPKDNDNTDYQAILAWVAEGNTIEEAD
jgi:hypothetical protein